jgi:hypothetical protein
VLRLKNVGYNLQNMKKKIIPLIYQEEKSIYAPHKTNNNNNNNDDDDE